MKKILKSRIFIFIISGLIFGSIGVYAATLYNSEQVTYKSTNVKAALDDLFGRMTESEGKSSLEAGLPIGQDVYINPRTKKTCNPEDAVSLTGTKTGCMKWYVYKDNGDGTYGLILDHNTTAGVVYNSTGSNSSMKEIQIELDKLVSESHWDSSLVARLITAKEIADITGNEQFNVATTPLSIIYFDTHTSSSSSTCTNGNTSGCKYGWLYDRTRENCENYGCLNNSVVDTLGYWTSSPIAGRSNAIWTVNFRGYFGYDVVGSGSYALRPVITF